MWKMTGCLGAVLLAVGCASDVNTLELDGGGALNALEHVTWLRVQGDETSDVLLLTSGDLGSCASVQGRVLDVQELLRERVQLNPYQDTSYHLCADDPADLRTLASRMEPLVGAGAQTMALGFGGPDDRYFRPLSSGTFRPASATSDAPDRLSTAEANIYPSSPITRTADEADEEGCAFLYESGTPPSDHHRVERDAGVVELEVEGELVTGSVDLSMVAIDGGGVSAVQASLTATRCEVDLPGWAGFGSLPFVMSFAF